jgi:hypothetical protein
MRTIAALIGPVRCPAFWWVVLLVQIGMKLVVPLPDTGGTFKLRFRPEDDWADEAD